jgi:hypothetical protein
MRRETTEYRMSFRWPCCQHSTAARGRSTPASGGALVWSQPCLYDAPRCSCCWRAACRSCGTPRSAPYQCTHRAVMMHTLLHGVTARFTHPMLPGPCVDTRDPQGAMFPFFLLSVPERVLQCLLYLPPSYRDAVLGPAPKAFGQLEHLHPVEGHAAGALAGAKGPESVYVYCGVKEQTMVVQAASR